MKGMTFTLIVLGFGMFITGKIIREKSEPLTPTRPPATLQAQHAPKYECRTIDMERATTYQPTESQCDSNPLTTADGSKINPDYYQKWVALSRDLLKRWGGEFDYGDTLDIYSKEHPNLNGEWVVRDCMNARYKMSIDFLLEPEKNYPKLGVGTDVKILICPEL